MAEGRTTLEGYIRFLLRNRIAVLLLITLVTGVFAYGVSTLKIATDFFALYPPKHPYIQLYNQYRNMFGTANVLICAVEVKKGDIYNLDTIRKIDRKGNAGLFRTSAQSLAVRN